MPLLHDERRTRNIRRKGGLSERVARRGAQQLRRAVAPPPKHRRAAPPDPAPDADAATGARQPEAVSGEARRRLDAGATTTAVYVRTAWSPPAGWLGEWTFWD